MADNFKPNKITDVINKTRAGEYKTKYIKSGSFLPKVFNTELNKKWLDSTLDQMLSKGDLQDIDAYIGSRLGKHRIADDSYLEEDSHIAERTNVHLSPAVTSYNDNGFIENTISFDDISNRIKAITDQYNYGSAYATDAYTFAPPIDVDKFVNHTSYYWIPDMPMYVSGNTSLEFSDVQGGATYFWQDENGDEFWLQNNQRIAFPDMDRCVYMVTGVGEKIRLIKIIDADGNWTYDFTTPGSSADVRGIWDKRHPVTGEIIPWDTRPWDYDSVVMYAEGKDYLIMDRADWRDNAWSRNNNWVHVDTITEMAELMGFADKVSYFLTSERRAVRPIIEFKTGLTMMDGQEKVKMNQPIWFRVRIDTGEWADELPGTQFKGSKIFGYKEGTGDIDNELGFPVVRRDTGRSSDIVFSNFLDNETISYTIRNESDFLINSRIYSGQLFYVLNGHIEQNYYPLRRPLYIKNRKQEQVGDVVSDVVFQVGSNEWTSTRELIIHTVDQGHWAVSELYADGAYINPEQKHPSLQLEANTSYEFHNLIPYTRIVFFDKNTQPLYANGFDGISFSYTTPAHGEEIFYAVIYPDDHLFGNDYKGKIYTDRNADTQRHTVFINGKALHRDEYQVTETTTTIPLDLLSVGDIVDMEYVVTHPTKEHSETIPEIFEYNTSQIRVQDLTISETIEHWKQQVSSTVDFAVTPLGHTNAHRLPRFNTYGGNILLPKHSVLAHALSNTDDDFSIANAVLEQGKDWWAFKRRLENQVRRTWNTTAVTSVRELTDSVLHLLTVTKQGSEVHRDTNMIYMTSTDRLQKFTVYEETSEFYLRSSTNADKNISDHVYVYMKIFAGTQPIERILSKDSEYSIVGNKLTLNTPTPAGIKTEVQVFKTDMDTDSYVPASLTKLFVDRIHRPRIVDSTLICHDGDEYKFGEWTSATQLLKMMFDITSPTFDPVLAVMYDIEQRIYAGMVVGTTANHDGLRPSQHRSTWFTNFDLENDMMYRYYKMWLRDTRQEPTKTLPDVEDDAGWTWNYSHIDVGGHLGKLPGYWRAAYYTLFDTDRPDLFPWFMLGFTHKPEWWDTYYSWSDSDIFEHGDHTHTKRELLLRSLARGIVSEPFAGVVDVRYARYYWDWENQSPVDDNGNLRAPIEVLVADPAERVFDINFAQEFKFVDWDEFQMQWRKSSHGRAAYIASVSTLSPVQAWNESYVPGSSNDVATLNSIRLAGDTYRAITDIDIVVKNGVPQSEVITEENAVVEFFNGTNAVAAEAIISLTDDNRISAFSLIDRGSEYVFEPFINVRANGKNFFVDAEIEFATIKFISSGYDQLISNYLRKYQIDYSFSEQIRTAHTRLIQKIGGFTSKNLINLYAESSQAGEFTLASFDYDLLMYKGKPTEIANASSMIITKTDSGYVVDGMSADKQQFYFYEPDASKLSGIKEINIGETGNTVKQLPFSSVLSIAEYDTKFKRIQDVYNFVRGNFKFIEDSGYTLEKTANQYALDFASWAVAAGVGTTFVLRVGKTLEFSPVHGTVLEINSAKHQLNSIIGLDGRTINLSNVTVTRSDTGIKVETNDDIGSITFAVADFEHALLFKNITDFKRIVFDDVLMRRQNRLKIRGQRTKDWHGKKAAPGFLVMNDTIVQNWDSSVDDIRDFYDVNLTKFNDSIETAERLTNGNILRSWTGDVNVSQNTMNEYYKGAIREKGTNAIIEQLNNTSVINYGDSDIQHHEVWMFRDRLFGDTSNFNATEVEIRRKEFTDTQQLINFVDTETGNGIDILTRGILSGGRPRYVNGSKPEFNIVDFIDRDLKLPTAGDLLEDEADYTATTVVDILDMYDEIKGETIETWNSLTSYKRGDKVRLDGKLYECNVQATGLSFVSQEISFSSPIRFPTVNSGVVAIFRESATDDYVEIDFGSSGVVTQEIVIVSTNTPESILSSDGANLTLDGTVIDMEEFELVIQPSVFPVTPAGTQQPILENTLVTRTITVNGVTVDFGEPGAPSFADETLVGDGVQTTFALDRVLGQVVTNPLFDVFVASVTVDGVTLTENVDYTVDEGSSSITFTTAPGTANQRYVSDGYVASDYVFDGLVDIVVAYDVSNTKNFDQIKERIESNVSNVLVFLDDNDRFRIRSTISGTSSVLVIGSGSANDELGLVAGEYFGGSTTTPVHSLLSMEEAVSRINASNIDGVSAIVNNSGNMVIVSLNNNLTINGSTSFLTQVGLTAGTVIAETSSVETASDITDIVLKLNTAFQENSMTITAAAVDGFLVIDTASSYLEIGSSEFLQEIGLGATETNSQGQSVAVISSISDTINNSFIETEWTDISDDDESLATIWVQDDSGFEYDVLAQRQIRFNSWNVYKFMNFGYFSSDADGCSICAGNTTADGNDAQITFNADHNLHVGDYVMIHNSTTVPSVDGIHRVTRIDQFNPRVAYIDMYIDECGTCSTIHVMRSIRFAEFVPNVDIVNYSHTADDLIFVTPFENTKQTGTFVHSVIPADTILQYNSLPVRQTVSRVKNDDILNLTVYDYRRNDRGVELEVYDPLRGIIPGVADREINFKSPVDLAVYSHSTELTFNGSENAAWGENEVGKVWWNTSTVSYYDYTQGDKEYNSKMWGRLFPGSSIDVYEWVKSDVPPDEWEEAVKSKRVVLGKVATGTAWAVWDSSTNEDIYFYTERHVWNRAVLKYETVYYFWVKNKLTIETTSRRLTTYDIAQIIKNPTTAGISWCAAIDNESMIVANMKEYVNTNETVLQINRILDKTAHSSWIEITETIDEIPKFWYETQRDNLVGYTSRFVNYTTEADNTPWEEGIAYTLGNLVVFEGVQYVCVRDVSPLDSFNTQQIKDCWIERDNFVLMAQRPNPFLHEFNRFGTDVDINQTWFRDMFSARRQVIAVANRLMKHINIYDSLSESWPNRFPEFKELWSWIPYVDKSRNAVQRPTITLSRKSELDTVDVTRHTLVKVIQYDVADDLDRSEIHEWNGTEWNLVEKNNATIEINDLLWNKARLNTWDMQPWDTDMWDFDYNKGMHSLYEALRYDIFVGRWKDYFNELWFAGVEHAISENDTTDWVYKTTYIKVDVKTPITDKPKRYIRENVDTVLGYINTVKPFHTKLRQMFDTRPVNEELSLKLTDDAKLNVKVQFGPAEEYPVDTTIAPDNFTTYRDVYEDYEFSGLQLNGGEFEEYTNDIHASDWSVADDTVYNNGKFVQPQLYNWDGSTYRRYLANMEVSDNAAIVVTTDNNGTTTKFVQLVDSKGKSAKYQLLESETAELITDVTETDIVMDVANAESYDSYGLAFIGGELIKYRTVLNDNVLDIERGVKGTTAKTHNSGTKIIFLKNEVI